MKERKIGGNQNTHGLDYNTNKLSRKFGRFGKRHKLRFKLNT